jgi:hypothetical protein
MLAKYERLGSKVNPRGLSVLTDAIRANNPSILKRHMNSSNECIIFYIATRAPPTAVRTLLQKITVFDD